MAPHFGEELIGCACPRMIGTAGAGVLRTRAQQMPGPDAQPQLALERRLVAVATGRAGRPRVGVLAAGAALRGRGLAPVAVGAADLLDLRRGVPQAGADLVDLELVDGALLAFLGLVRPLLEPAGHDDAHA